MYSKLAGQPQYPVSPALSRFRRGLAPCRIGDQTLAMLDDGSNPPQPLSNFGSAELRLFAESAAISTSVGALVVIAL